MDSQLWQVIDNLPNVIFIIYKRNIVFANKYALNKLEYSTEELKNLTIEDLVPAKDCENIIKIKDRRLKGEDFQEFYYDFPLISKNKKILKCTLTSYTIKFNDEYAGLIAAIDLTEKIFLEKVLKLIDEINELTGIELDEITFIKNVCEKFFHTLEVNYSFIVNVENFEILNICKSQTCECEILEKNFLDLLKHRERNKIFSTQIELKYLRSVCVIPISVKDNEKYLFVILSEYTNFMDNLNRSLLEKIKKIIESNIKKIEEEVHLKILFTALENSPDWVIITDRSGKIIYANKTVEKLSEYNKEELLGKKPSIFRSGYYGKEFYEKMWNTLLSGKNFSGVLLNKSKSGKLFKIEHLIIPVKTNGEITYFVSIGKDISREEKLEGEIFTLKYKDLLTGLFNRYGFLIEAQNSINKLKSDEKAILLIIDIYNFSHLNNIYSQKVGDEILKNIAEFLLKISIDTVVGRVGGDEFAIFKRIKRKNIIGYLQSLIDIFKISKFTSREINISINIGASIFPDDSKDLNQLFTLAGASLKIAKSKGENTFEVYNKEIAEIIIRKKEEKDLIIEALENDLFEIYLQPYFYTLDLKLAGFEALLRINHPEKGILSPAYFIDTLEESEYLFDVEKFLINRVCTTLKKWEENFKILKPISINLTARSFKNSDIINFIIHWIYKIQQPLLNIELTERLFIDDFDYTVSTIRKLKDFGISISLDDFGTGYSSLAYLPVLPIDYIKIDISFTKKMLEDLKTKIIVETIISLSKKLKIKTIAEGVETEKQLNILREYSCNIVQGYLFSRPLPIKKAEKFLLSS